MYDLELTLRLKQGQVELPTSSLGMGIDTSDAVLVHRSFVESLNGARRASPPHAYAGTDTSCDLVRRPGLRLGIFTDETACCAVPTAPAAEVRRQGKARVDGLTQIKDFKREIYALQWENKRADMEARLAGRLAAVALQRPADPAVILPRRPCLTSLRLRTAAQIEDLLENNRALQLLKLPKNYQQMLELARF